MAKIHNYIGQALESYICPYCGKVMKSASGRTLHRQAPCKKIAPNVKAAKKLIVGQEVVYRHNAHKIVQIEDGLVAFKDGTVISALKLGESDPRPKEIKKIKSPRTALEWVNNYVKLREEVKDLGAYIRCLFKLSSYVRYKRWTPEDLESALQRHGL